MLSKTIIAILLIIGLGFVSFSVTAPLDPMGQAVAFDWVRIPR